MTIRKNDCRSNRPVSSDRLLTVTKTGKQSVSGTEVENTLSILGCAETPDGGKGRLSLSCSQFCSQYRRGGYNSINKLFIICVVEHHNGDVVILCDSSKTQSQNEYILLCVKDSSEQQYEVSQLNSGLV